MKIGKVLAITITLLLLSIAAPSWALEPVSTCQALDRWAAQLEKLPADYASFTALEPAQRRAVYPRLSDDQRAALWHEQLSRELAQDGWNEAQRALIAETRAFATAENIGAMVSGFGSRQETAKAAAGSLEKRVKQAFPREQATRIFFALGPQPAAAAPGSGLFVQCACSINYDDPCGPEGQCIPGGCQEVKSCGFILGNTCDGLCWI